MTRMHKCMRYFNWFIVFPNFEQASLCNQLVFRVFVSSAFWKWNSGRRILLNRSSLLAFCVLGYEILSTNFDLGMGDWISSGDNDNLLFGKENERKSRGFVAGSSAKRQCLSLKLSGKRRACEVQ